jgi:TRAP-type C4-dicarboxylate transport system permease small subunit
MMRRLIGILTAALWVTTALLLTAIVVIVSYQVFARFLLGFSPSWTEELALILMVWLAMLGSALGVRLNDHISIEFVASSLRGRPRWLIYRFSEAVTALFGGFMILEGWGLATRTLGQTFAVTKLPAGYMYFSIPVAGVFIVLYVIEGWLDPRYRAAALAVDGKDPVAAGYPPVEGAERAS